MMYVKDGSLLTDDGYLVEAIAVTPLEDYKVLVELETGKKIVFDMTPYLDEPYFEGLRDKKVFDAVVWEDYGAPAWMDESIGLNAIMGLCTIFEDGEHIN